LRSTGREVTIERMSGKHVLVGMVGLGIAGAVVAACGGFEGTEPISDGGTSADAVHADAAPRQLPCPDGGPCRHVLTTTEIFSGDLREDGGLGLEGADSKCQAFADKEGLGGTWKAWLGTSSTAPRDRFTGVWYNVDGEKAVTNAGGAVGPATAVIKGANGASPGAVWTGSTDVGGRSDFRCNDWSDDSPDAAGNTGNAAIDSTESGKASWAGNNKKPCKAKFPLYCFEQ